MTADTPVSERFAGSVTKSVASLETEAEWAPIPARPSWLRSYLRNAVVADGACALIAGALAIEVRFASFGYLPAAYLVFTCGLPALWCASLLMAGGYDGRFVGLGSDEFRRVQNAAVTLTAGLAIISYAAKLEIARGYMAIALPSVMALGLTTRYLLRRRLYRMRSQGLCTRRVVAVGHAPTVADLVTSLRRDRRHGLYVAAACVAGPACGAAVAGTPVAGGLDEVTEAVRTFSADAVTVLGCPEMDGPRLRGLAWQLEKTGTDLFVASALLDVAGPRTTIRPVAGLPLLHVDHPELTGGKQVVKNIFDRLCAGLALVALAPVFAVIAVIIRADSPGPAFFRQMRVGKNGRAFTLYKFRTMVVDAEQKKAMLAAKNEACGALFKIRRDPRVTAVGAWLRRWSLDELPQLLNVILGDMSLVGPRPALQEETAQYGYPMRRRLAVKPGITGLWQVSGRSDLPADEAVRLDVRYVENWSFALDLQIVWKTGWAVIRGQGAYLVVWPVSSSGSGPGGGVAQVEAAGGVEGLLAGADGQAGGEE